MEGGKIKLLLMEGGRGILPFLFELIPKGKGPGDVSEE
jgi:hypothetical protein